MNLLLKSAIIVDPENKGLHLKKRDILIKNGIISKIASKIDNTAKIKEISVKGLHVSKGWFDSSVSFGEPGYEERETLENGLYTAAKSGFTDIVLNTNTHPVPDTSGAIAFFKKTTHTVTNLHPLATLSVKGEGQALAELYDMKNAGAKGFYDYKKTVDNANLLKIALQYTQSFDGLVYSFPLNSKIAGKGIVNEGAHATALGLRGIPALAEELNIARDLFILEYTGGKLHIPTISTAKAVQLIAEAKKKGLDVSCSVALHNLIFTDASLESFDTNFKLMPPLRTSKDAKALLKGLKTGIIDFVTTDHTPITIEEKHVEFDNACFGSLGLESAFGILNQLLGLTQTIGLLTKGRERYDIEIPAIKEGAMANLTLFDPETTAVLNKKQLHSTSKNSMYLGKKLKGHVIGVINNNRIIN